MVRQVHLEVTKRHEIKIKKCRVYLAQHLDMLQMLGEIIGFFQQICNLECVIFF